MRRVRRGCIGGSTRSSERSWIPSLVRRILPAEPLVDDFGACFAGVGGAKIDALADSFRFDRCDQRRRLRDTLRAVAPAPAAA